VGRLNQQHVVVVHGLVLDPIAGRTSGVVAEEYVRVVVVQMQRGNRTWTQFTRLCKTMRLEVTTADVFGAVPLWYGLDLEIVAPLGALIALLRKIQHRQLNVVHLADNASYRLVGGQVDRADMFTPVSLSIREPECLAPLSKQRGIFKNKNKIFKLNI